MKHCNKCGAKLHKGKKFCNKCGDKIIKKELKTREHKEKAKKVHYNIPHWLIPWIVLGALVVVASILLLPTKVVSYQVDVPYIDTETYTVQVPYEDVEEYTESVPYETTETYIETIPVTEQEAYTVNTIVSETSCDVSYNECTCFEWSFWTGKCKKCNCEETKYRTVTNYKDVVQEKQVTKYRDETKYRKVTKTRTETKERDVQKTRTETRQKEVNWLFDFDAIIKFRD